MLVCLPQKDVFKVVGHAVRIDIASEIALIQYFSGTINGKKKNEI